MGRLIDADAFIEYVNRRFDLCSDELRMMIEEQPTAYDVEKVVAELESKRDYRELTNYYGDVIGVRNIDTIKIDKAIDIVKRGGVE